MNICRACGEDNMIDGKFRAVKYVCVCVYIYIYIYIYRIMFDRAPLVLCVVDTSILFAVRQSAFGKDWLQIFNYALLYPKL